MQRKSTIIAILLLLTSLSKPNSYINSVEGYLDDVSPSGKWMLYRVPDVWESDDYHEGSLRVLNLKTGEIIVILDKITIEDPVNAFLSDSLVAIPARGKVSLYNLEKKKFDGTLLRFKEDHAFLQFSLNEDKTMAAVLLRDFETEKVDLKIVDLAHNKAYTIGHHNYNRGESVYAIGDILWHGDQVVYSFQSKLYYYQLGQPHDMLISKWMHTYALDGNRLIFAEKFRFKYSFKSFSFSDLSVHKLELSDDSLADPLAYVELYTAKINNTLRSFLSIDDKNYFTANEKGVFEQRDKLLLYRDQYLFIERLNTKIPDLNSKGTTNKSELIIKKTSGTFKTTI